MDNILNWKGKDDWTAQLSLMEQYDQYYGIFDHESHLLDDPLSVIGMHPAENAITGSRLELMTLELVACRLPELTNTSLLELLSYPRWFLDKLLEDGRRVRKNEEEEALKMRKNLEEMAANKQQPKGNKRGNHNPNALPT